MAELLLAAAAEALVALVVGLAWDALRRTIVALVSATRPGPAAG